LLVLGNRGLRERLAFRVAWLAGIAWLRLPAGKAFHTLPPSGPDAAAYRPVIIRLRSDIAASITLALDRLREHGPQHFYYPPESMHVTIQALGPLLLDGPDSAARLEALRNLVGSYPSFDLTMRGLNVSPGTVFAQVIPHGPELGKLRRDVRALQGGDRQLDLASSLGVFARTLLPHANVVRFSGRVTAGFLDELSRSRWEYFGRWTVHEVELVRTDRLLSQEGTQVLERMPLATP
jgi:2'-5' RNA ligase